MRSTMATHRNIRSETAAASGCPTGRPSRKPAEGRHTYRDGVRSRMQRNHVVMEKEPQYPDLSGQPRADLASTLPVFHLMPLFQDTGPVDDSVNYPGSAKWNAKKWNNATRHYGPKAPMLAKVKTARAPPYRTSSGDWIIKADVVEEIDLTCEADIPAGQENCWEDGGLLTKGGSDIDVLFQISRIPEMWFSSKPNLVVMRNDKILASVPLVTHTLVKSVVITQCRGADVIVLQIQERQLRRSEPGLCLGRFSFTGAQLSMAPQHVLDFTLQALSGRRLQLLDIKLVGRPRRGKKRSCNVILDVTSNFLPTEASVFVVVMCREEETGQFFYVCQAPAESSQNPRFQPMALSNLNVFSHADQELELRVYEHHDNQYAGGLNENYLLGSISILLSEYTGLVKQHRQWRYPLMRRGQMVNGGEATLTLNPQRVDMNLLKELSGANPVAAYSLLHKDRVKLVVDTRNFPREWEKDHIMDVFSHGEWVQRVELDDTKTATFIVGQRQGVCDEGRPFQFYVRTHGAFNMDDDRKTMLVYRDVAESDCFNLQELIRTSRGLNLRMRPYHQESEDADDNAAFPFSIAATDPLFKTIPVSIPISFKDMPEPLGQAHKHLFFVAVYRKDNHNSNYCLIATTTSTRNSCHAVHTLFHHYTKFSEQVRFSVYVHREMGNTNGQLDESDYIGSAEIPLLDYLHSCEQTELQLTRNGTPVNHGRAMLILDVSDAHYQKEYENMRRLCVDEARSGELAQHWKAIHEQGPFIASVQQVHMYTCSIWPCLKHKDAARRAYRATMQRGQFDNYDDWWVEQKEFGPFLLNLVCFARLLKMFSGVDREQSQRLTCDEFKIAATHMINGISKEEVHAEYNKITMDGSHTLSFPEFLVWAVAATRMCEEDEVVCDVYPKMLRKHSSDETAKVVEEKKRLKLVRAANVRRSTMVTAAVREMGQPGQPNLRGLLPLP